MDAQVVTVGPDGSLGLAFTALEDRSRGPAGVQLRTPKGTEDRRGHEASAHNPATDPSRADRASNRYRESLSPAVIEMREAFPHLVARTAARYHHGRLPRRGDDLGAPTVWVRGRADADQQLHKALTAS